MELYNRKLTFFWNDLLYNFIWSPRNNEKMKDYYLDLFNQLTSQTGELFFLKNDAFKSFSENFMYSKYPKEFLLKKRFEIPLPSDGFSALKSHLEPRKILFDFIKTKYGPLLNNKYLIRNFVDDAWVDFVYVKYARKLRLYEEFCVRSKKFAERFKDEKGIKEWPVEVYLEVLEEIKYVREVSKNYRRGVEICEDYMFNLKNIININGINSF